MNYFLWTEDSTAGKEFWGLVSRLRYNNQLNVESKGNNEDLVKAVELLKVLKPIDNAILTRDKNKTNEMEIF